MQTWRVFAEPVTYTIYILPLLSEAALDLKASYIAFLMRISSSYICGKIGLMCMCTQFDHIFGFQNLITLLIKIVPFIQRFIGNLMQLNILISKGDMDHIMKRCILCTKAQFSHAGSHIIIVCPMQYLIFLSLDFLYECNRLLDMKTFNKNKLELSCYDATTCTYVYWISSIQM